MMNSSLSHKPNKILVLALSGIGNLLMQLPTITALKKQHPDWHLTLWVAPRGTYALAASNPNIDDVIEAPIKTSGLQHVRHILELRRKKFDIGLVLSPGQLAKSAAYLFLAGIPQRVGHAYRLRTNLQSTFLLTDPISRDDNLHDIEQNLNLLTPLGITYSLPATNYKLAIPSSHKLRARQLIAKLSISSDKKIIGLHPGSAPDFLWKRWPLENFATVGKNLINHHHAHILVFSGPGEEDLAKQLQRQLGPHSTVVTADLLTAAALAQECRFFLANDSGLMHLAAAVGTPTVGLFGPTDEKKTGPRAPNSFTIRAPNTTPVYHTVNNYHLGSQPHPTILALKPDLVISTIHNNLVL